MSKKLESNQRLRMALVGPCASGKTTLLKEVLYKLRGTFHEIHLFSPVAHLQEIYQKEIFIKKEHKYEECTDENFERVYDTLKSKNKDVKKEILIIVDDALKCSIFKSISKHILKMRHEGISIIILAQYLKGVDPIIRSNISHLVLFQFDNRGERLKLRDEYGDKFIESYDEYTQKPYGYVYADFTKNILDPLRYLNHIPKSLS